MLRGNEKAPVVGPFSPLRALWLPTLRTVGYRKTGNRLAPILHAKMLLLGELWRHDEDDFGIADITGFRPQNSDSEAPTAPRAHEPTSKAHGPG